MTRRSERREGERCARAVSQLAARITATAPGKRWCRLLSAKTSTASGTLASGMYGSSPYPVRRSLYTLAMETFAVTHSTDPVIRCRPQALPQVQSICDRCQADLARQYPAGERGVAAAAQQVLGQQALLMVEIDEHEVGHGAGG